MERSNCKTAIGSRCFTLILVSVACLSMFSAQVWPAETVVVGPGGTREISVTFNFNAADLSFGKMGNFDTVSLVGGRVNPSSPGVPALPSKTVSILLPSGAEVVGIQALSRDSLVATGILPAPVQPPPIIAQAPPAWVEPDVDVYAGGEMFPKDAAKLTAGTQKMRGWCLAEVTLCPVRYLPAAEELYLADEIVVVVQYTLSGARPMAPLRGNARFEAMVKKLVVNPDLPDAAPLIGAKGDLGTPAGSQSESMESLGDAGTESVNPPGEGTVDYLIITPQMMVSAFQKLADHRAAFNGWDTQVVSVETIASQYSGVDIQAKIRNCIIDNVNNNGTSFVLLGGDDIRVPDRDCFCATYGGTEVDYTVPTDMYYAGLDGTWDQWNNNGVYGEVDVNGVPSQDENDKLIDVYVGRIPVRSAYQAEDYVKKVVMYDDVQDDYFMHKVLLGGWVCWDIWQRNARPTDPVCDGHIGYRETNHPKVSDTEYWMRRDYKVGLCDNSWPTSVVKILVDTLNTWDNNGILTKTDVVTVSPADIVVRMSEGFQYVHQSSHGWPQGFSMSGDFSSTEAAAMTGMVNVCYSSACDVGAFDHAEPSVNEALIRNPIGGSVAFVGAGRTNYGGCGEVLQTEWFKVLGPRVRTNLADVFYQHKLVCDVDNCEYCRHLFYSMNLLGDPGLELIYVTPTWGGVSSPWSTQDIGAVGATGSAYANAGQFVVKGSGVDVDGTADEFRYVYKSLSGDGELVARVDYLTNTDNPAVGGVMIRETLTAGSKHALMAVTGGNGTVFKYRTATDGATTTTSPADGVKVPYWVKIVRSGSNVTGYKSQYGSSWTQVGTTSISMASGVYVGMAVSSSNDGVLSTAKFYTGAPDTTPPTPNPATFSSAPTAVSMSAIAMTATYGSDENTVEYYFNETSGNPGGTDSGWQRDNSYTDVGLNADTQYTYKVQMRDACGNTGTESSGSSATTLSGILVTDDFNTARNYLTQGVSGTIWTGFVGLGTGETVTKLNANTDRSGQFYVQSSNGVWAEAWDPLGPFLYRTVSGDFVATIKVTEYENVNYNNFSLMARASKSPDQAGTGEDWVALDYFPLYSCGNIIRTADNNVRAEQCNNGLGFNLHPYMRLERVGNDFHFSTSTDGVNFSALSCSPISRPDMDGLTVQVGLAQATFSTSSGYVAADDFSVRYESTGPTPTPTNTPAVTNTPTPTNTPSCSNPGQATNPTPANGATGQPKAGLTLGWTAGSGATSHDVYFGTANPPPFKQNQTGTTYATGALSKLKWYYWRIDEKNACGTTTGVVWSFKTGS